MRDGMHGRERIEPKSDRAIGMDIEVLQRRTTLSWLWNDLE